jgi:hypothetical protein
LPEGLSALALLVAAGGAGTFGYAVIYAGALKRLSGQPWNLGRTATASLLITGLLIAVTLPLFLPMLSAAARSSIETWPGTVLFCAGTLGAELPSMRYLHRSIPREVPVGIASLTPVYRLLAVAMILSVVTTGAALWIALIVWLAGARLTV